MKKSLQITKMTEQLIADFAANIKRDLELQMVKNAPMSIIHMENPSVEAYLYVADKQTDILKSIKNPSYELCLAAVKKKGCSYKTYNNVPQDKRTDELRLAAVQNDGNAISIFDNNQLTIDICMAAVKTSYVALFTCSHSRSNTLIA